MVHHKRGRTTVETALTQMEIIRNAQQKIGRVVVLRDHSHSHFLTGKSIPSRPPLSEIPARRFEQRSLVTVRDPADSFASMEKTGMAHALFPVQFRGILPAARPFP